MKFDELIYLLQKGSAGVNKYFLGNNPEVTSCASIDLATSKQLSFLEKGNSLIHELTNSKASALLLPKQTDLQEIACKKDIAWVEMCDPRLGFAESLDILHPTKKPIKGIHPSAVIEDNVYLGDDVYIGAKVFIGEGSQIGSNTIIHPGVVIYEEVEVGENSELHANSVIHSKTKISKRCVIHSNAVIGSEGFGFVPTKKGWRKMPQTGIVVLEEDVEVGSCSTVDRPSVGETIIGAGTKIDNLVQIAHGVKTGKDCAMASQVGIAGGATLGNGVILAGQVGVGNRVKVGDKVVASSKTGIHANVEAGEIVSGFPAMPNRLWLRCSAIFRRLPEFASNIRELRKDSSE